MTDLRQRHARCASLRRIFGERVPALDCGDDAAALLNEVTGATNLRLMYHFQEVTQRGYVKRNSRFHTYRGSHAVSTSDFIHIFMNTKYKRSSEPAQDD